VGAAAKTATYLAYGIIDRDGHLWFSTESGILRVPLSEGTTGDLYWEESRQGKIVGLTGANALVMVEDLEGNIWVGSNGGLDRFRAPALAKVDVPAGWWLSMAPGNGDGIFVGALGRKVFKVSTNTMPELVPAPPVNDGVFSALYRDPRGDLWIGSFAGSTSTLWHQRGGRWRSLQPRPEVRIARSDGVVQIMAMDSAGAMWVSIVREGVYRVVGDTWIPFGGYADLPRQPATVITADDQKRVWFGYVDNRLVLLHDEHLTSFSNDQGLDIGVVLAITVRQGNVWTGGEGGLAWFDGQRFHAVRRAGGKSLPAISGIAAMANGDLWLGSAEGAMHIEAADILKMRNDAGHLVTPTVLSHLDGMPGTPYALRPLPSALSGSDGRVWFSTGSGVVWTDPKLQTRNAVVPTVLVNSIDADGTHHESLSEGPLRLRPRMQNLQISYTAPSLTMPERVHFKYRLEGQDSAWQDAGTRREAFYTDLAPGHYVFRVIASNNDDVWNEDGAAVEFIIPPTFVQTVWFTALWVAAALGLMLLIFAWWLRQAQAQLRSRLNERLVERERIARDLHDTFLQAVQGLMLRFQAAAERIPPQEPARTFMEDALDRADRVLADGRQKIMTLRSPEAPDTDFSQDIHIAGEGLARNSGVAFDFSVADTPRALHPIVREEAYRIVVEALANAFQHARASRVVARIDYGRRGLVMKIADDGCGFDTSVDRESAGHWGLRGMRERATRIRARLEINSRTGKGTGLELTVPGDIAYAGHGRAKRAGMWAFWRGARGDEET
jgi:signal transduction histidine kinase